MSSADPTSAAGRRSFLAAAAAAMAAAGTLKADEYGPDAAPVRYPDSVSYTHLRAHET